MTFPAGATPRGLPYPGTDGEPSDIPLYLQQLAEAYTTLVPTAGQTMVWDQITGGGGQTDNYGIVQVTTPKLKAVRGFVATPAAINGAVVTAPLNWDYNAKGVTGTAARLPLTFWRTVRGELTPGLPDNPPAYYWSLTTVYYHLIAWGIGLNDPS